MIKMRRVIKKKYHAFEIQEARGKYKYFLATKTRTLEQTYMQACEHLEFLVNKHNKNLDHVSFCDIDGVIINYYDFAEKPKISQNSQ